MNTYVDIRVFVCYNIFRIHMCSLTKYKERGIMFDNSGKKLKGFATAFFIIVSIIECISGIIIASNSKEASVSISIICILVVLILLNYILSLVLYGFGTVVDNVADIAEHFCDEDEEDVEDETDINQEPEICPRCCQCFLNKQGVCVKCGYEKDDD